MFRHSSRPGHVFTIPAVVLLAASIALLAMGSAARWSASSSRVPVPGAGGAPLLSLRPAWVGVEQFEAPSLESMLRRVSLDPAALTAAGVTSQQEVSALVGRVRSHLTEHGVSFALAKAAWLEARGECISLERVVRRGRATAQDLTNLASARTERDSCASAFDTAEDGFFDAGVDGLGGEVVGRLAAIRAHRATEFRELPVQHLVESRTDATLLALREALAEERICAKWNENVSGGTATLLSNERGRTAVAEARSRLDGSLSTVESYWSSAIEQ